MTNFIENEVAYEAAKQANIRRNASVGRRQRWLAGNPDANLVNDFLREQGEFRAVLNDASGYVHHPLYKAVWGGFMEKMFESLQEWGGLTDGQTAAVVKVIAQGREKVAGYAAKQAERVATSKHLWTIGERLTAELTVAFVAGYESQFGWVTITGYDFEGQSVIHKGTSLGLVKGDKAQITFTVKDHGERDGVKQTIISRPKIAKAK